MANLLEIAELAWDQMFPKPSVEAKINFEEFVATAKSEYAYQTLLAYWNEKQREGEMAVPGFLLAEIEKKVEDNEIDISDLNVFRSLPQEVWLQNIGGINCTCKYIKSTVNNSQLMADDDSLGDNARTYYVLGNKIKFPNGAHKKSLPIIYANMGENVDGRIEVDDAIGSLVRTKLIEIYGGKIAKEDKTENSNSDN